MQVRRKRHGLDPWVGKMSWRKAWQPTPVFLPRDFHGERSLEGYIPCSHIKSDMNEASKKAYLSLQDLH